MNLPLVTGLQAGRQVPLGAVEDRDWIVVFNSSVSFSLLWQIVLNLRQVFRVNCVMTVIMKAASMFIVLVMLVIVIVGVVMMFNAGLRIGLQRWHVIGGLMLARKTDATLQA